jgi:homocysteine S-methyltransferase
MPLAPSPLESDSLYLADGGLETTLVFLDGFELPEFAAFPLLESEDGRAHLARYFSLYLDLAERTGCGFVVDTVTWRANAHWGLLLGYDAGALAEVNRRAVDEAFGLAGSRPGLATVVNGVVGPRVDGYVVGETMTVDRAATYHAPQALAFAAAGAQLMTALTMTYAEEAIGIVESATQVDLPVVVSFTLETDGRLPSGQGLGEAIDQVDRATDGAAAYFMVNCAHPTHFASVLETEEPWIERVQAIRANSSTMSHAEIDGAEELDRGDVQGLASDYADLDRRLPHLRVAGGCCGTDHEHLTAIAEALTA